MGLCICELVECVNKERRREAKEKSESSRSSIGMKYCVCVCVCVSALSGTNIIVDGKRPTVKGFIDQLNIGITINRDSTQQHAATYTTRHQSASDTHQRIRRV